MKLTVAIGDCKLVSVRYVNSVPYVNIKSYTRDDHGRMFSTKRGIMLSADEWRRLKEDTGSIVFEKEESDKKLQKRNHTKRKKNQAKTML